MTTFQVRGLEEKGEGEVFPLWLLRVALGRVRPRIGLTVGVEARDEEHARVVFETRAGDGWIVEGVEPCNGKKTVWTMRMSA